MSIREILKNRRLLALGGLVLLALIFVFWNIGSPSADVAYGEVQKGEFIVSTKAKGELKAKNSQAVTVPRAGSFNIQIVRMAPEGSVVKAGDFLVQFDPTQAQQKLDEKQNALKNALAELESQKASIASNMAQLESALLTERYSHEQARLRFEQMKYEADAKRREQEINLRKAELSLKQAEERITAQKKIDAANLDKANLQVERARLELAEAERELASLTLTAPIDGLVVYKEIWGPSGPAKVKVGDTPWRGQEVIEIPDLSVMQVKANINEVEVSRIAKGQQVIIKLDALPEPTFHGTVSQIATLASRKRGSNVKEFEVMILIDGSDPRLKPGMSASVEIITDRIADAMYVPLESVFEKDGKIVVYPAGSAKSIPVEVGQKNANFIVINSGLKPGQKISLRDPTMPLEEIGKEAPKAIQKEQKKSGREERVMIIG
ncbi:MAG: efflux RND transporter periplasmic adaptor subunit [candidate division KSB1 bacterium]|nr:efflux RND transporter periplasmic adaptor subunit [candidate division KSB1 bacterium]MDZ7300718.1 efflux RND transporter periplasmic adaptor subunit [candidate division KSB1 bacterium]MDZ7310012.1 efflux RND transporter periplasmic adaptor subunit [candidate division KSB1 bacterium]